MPKYNINEIDRFNDNTSGIYSVEKGFYKFKDQPNYQTEKNIKDNLGYSFSHGFVIYIKLAKFFYGWFGDLNAILLMNLTIHTFTFLLVLRLMCNCTEKIMLLLLYGLNPFIIYLATFPYHYFVVSLVPAIILYSQNKKNSSKILLIAISLLISLNRTTIMPIIQYSVLKIFNNKIIILLYSLLIILIYLLIKKYTYGDYQPYFTAVIGLGAYTNDFGFYLSDHSALNILSQHKYKNGYLFNNEMYYSDQDFFKEYFLHTLNQQPSLIINNFIRNIFQLFGGGYWVGKYLYNNVATILGSIYLMILINYKLYNILLLIIMSAIGVILFFPPIPSYIAASYILLVYSLIKVWSLQIKKLIPILSQ